MGTASGPERELRYCLKYHAPMPEANDLTGGIMALVAQQDCDAISRRTWEARSAAKARGAKLGNPNVLHRQGGLRCVETHSAPP